MSAITAADLAAYIADGGSARCDVCGDKDSPVAVGTLRSGRLSTRCMKHGSALLRILAIAAPLPKGVDLAHAMGIEPAQGVH